MCSLNTRSFSACGSSSHERASCTSISTNFISSSVVLLDDLTTMSSGHAQNRQNATGQWLIFFRAGFWILLGTGWTEAAVAPGLAGVLSRIFCGMDIRYPSLRIAAVWSHLAL